MPDTSALTPEVIEAFLADIRRAATALLGTDKTDKANDLLWACEQGLWHMGETAVQA